MLENGEAVYASFGQAVKEVHPPGFDGTIVMHMGRTKRPLTVKGLFTSSLPTKIATMEAFVNRITGTLKVPWGDGTFRSFTKVRLLEVRWVRFVMTTTGMTVEYEAQFEQIEPPLSFTGTTG